MLENGYKNIICKVRVCLHAYSEGQYNPLLQQFHFLPRDNKCANEYTE